MSGVRIFIALETHGQATKKEDIGGVVGGLEIAEGRTKRTLGRTSESTSGAAANNTTN